jgi:LMBR1-like membrane protein
VLCEALRALDGNRCLPTMQLLCVPSTMPPRVRSATIADICVAGMQGEDRDHKWVIYVLSFWASLFMGIIFALVALSWIVHIIVYILVKPPLTPFLNTMFAKLDDAFRLFGVAFFALWCFFLIIAAIKGFTKLGLNFGFIQLYPMKVRSA